jgi:type IV pilus assembly protein PilW
MNTSPPMMMRGRERGFSLLELMIALAIGLFLLSGMAAVFVTSNRTYTDLNRASQQIENGRFAVQMVGDDVALAGHYGRLFTQLPVPGALPDPCEAASMPALRAAVALPLQGYDAPASSPITACVPVANHVAGTDILVVRRADSQATAPASLIAPQVYMQTNADPNNSSNPIVAAGTSANFPLFNRDGTTIAPIRKYHVHIYFVAPCSIPAGGGTVCTGATDDGGSPIPTLKRLELTVNPSTNALQMFQVSLVEGIENFQVDYGIDADGDGIPNGSYVTQPGSLAQWVDVVAVRLNVLARNLEPSVGYTDTKQYDLGAAGPSTPGGAYKRHVYNAVIRVVNPSSRRES